MTQNMLENVAITTVAPRPRINCQKCGDSRLLKSMLSMQTQGAVKTHFLIPATVLQAPK
jgi:hypothetical protein